MRDVLLSIYVPVFNHENYITRALDSILMQKTQYTYEVLIGEDCSTDNTRAVLQAWEKAHPDARFTYFYREQNMFHTDCSNPRDLRMRCKGKYVISLEGDDFWTDPDKLEKQIRFLEDHPDYYAVAHNCTVVGKDSLPNGETYPECKDIDYTFRHFANDILPGQLTTMMIRNYKIDPNFDGSLLAQRIAAADRNIAFSVLCHGKIHCIQQSMSAYRHITTSGSSFSATYRYNYETEKFANLCRLEYAYRIGNSDAIRYAEYLYLRNLRHALRTGHISRSAARTEIKPVQHKLRALFLLLKRDINLRLLHKKLPV